MVLGLLFIVAAIPGQDIELRASAEAKSVSIENIGAAHLTVHATPDGGTAVRAEAPRANGRKTIKNVKVVVAGTANIAQPEVATLSATQQGEPK